MLYKRDSKKFKGRYNFKGVGKKISKKFRRINNGKEENSTYEDVRNKIIFENYEEQMSRKKWNR